MPSGAHHLKGLLDPSDRLLVAFRLYRSGKAPLVFCSGGNNTIGNQTGKIPEATWMVRLLEEWNIPSTAIQIEGGSINTHENAIRTYQMLSSHSVRRILLVTSAMHLPRAAAAFRKSGLRGDRGAADFRTGWGEPNVLVGWLPSADNLSKSDAACTSGWALPYTAREAGCRLASSQQRRRSARLSGN
jgi:uncharacterized SAM-binding protein YcdF (DUF218 family)